MKKGRWFWLTMVVALGSTAFGWGSSAYGALPGGTLDPTTIPKYVTPLFIPPVMPKTGEIKQKGADIDYSEIAVRQFTQQVLPKPLHKTTVWGYGSKNHPGSFHYPSATIEARVDQPVRVKWINDLKNPDTGKFLKHLLPVDQTLHWANPGQAGGAGIDSRPPWPDGTPVPYMDRSPW